MALFLAFIMISSIGGVVLTSSHITGTADVQRVELGEYTFTQTHQGYTTYTDDEQIIIISSDPRTLDVAATPDIDIAELNSGNKLYIAFQPEENTQTTLAHFDANIRPRLRSFTPACIKDSTQCSSLPLITCENASPYIKVIQIQLANESSVTYENNCLLVEGNQFQIQSMLDALILRLLLY